MNKTFNINLGGYPFAIDEDAFIYIQNYLSTIRHHFSTSDGCDEILYDIEVRMAELFQEHLKGRSIISMKEIDEVIMIMGKPEDFGAEPMAEAHYSSSRNKRQDGSIKVGKRLFRDPDDKKISGVCSGIAAYFGIEDPLWIRILFALLFFSGFGLITYIVLWALVPVASSASDKLAMRGEPATIQNIAKVVEDELSELGEKINEWSKDIGSKKKDSTVGLGSKTKSILGGAVNIIGQLISGIIPVIRTVFKPLLVFISILMIAVLGISWGAVVLGLSVASPILSSVGPSSSFLTVLGVISLIITLAIPILSIMLFIARLGFGYRVHRTFNPIVWTVWFVALFSFITTGVITAKEYSNHFQSSQISDYFIKNDEIKIVSPDEKSDKSFGISLGHTFIDKDDKWAVKNIKISIEKSNDDQVHINKKIQSRGRTENEAEKNASLIQNDITINGNEISIPKYLYYPKNTKFREQEVDYIIYIPEGKKVTFNNNMKEILRSSDLFTWDQIYSNLENNEWTILDGRATSALWESEHNYKKDIAIGEYSKVIIESGFDVIITQGNTSQLTFDGNKDAIQYIEHRNLDGTLTIQMNEKSNPEDITINITTPSLELIYLDDVNSAKIEGFSQDALKLVCKGERNHSKITFYGAVKVLDLTIQNDQDVTLNGTGEKIDINMEGGRLNADKFIAKIGSFQGQNYDQADLYLTESITLDSTAENSRINIIGNPKRINR